MSLDVRQWGKSWYLVEGGVKVAGPFALKGSAERRKLALEQGMSEHARPQRETTQRACLCCRMTFASEGPHNRLCPVCRRRDGEGVAHGMAVSRTRRGAQ